MIGMTRVVFIFVLFCQKAGQPELIAHEKASEQNMVPAGNA
jgi:hypothetical protein